MTEYYKCILDNTGSFTEGRIYKIINPSDLETPFNFIDDKGEKNGWCGVNYFHFTAATLQEWIAQEYRDSGREESINSDCSYLVEFFNQNNIK